GPAGLAAGDGLLSTGEWPHRRDRCGSGRENRAAAPRHSRRQRRGGSRADSAQSRRTLCALPAPCGAPAMNSVVTVAAKEIQQAIRNRWVLASTLLLAGLALSLTFLGSAPTGNVGVRTLDVVIVSLSS